MRLSDEQREHEAIVVALERHDAEAALRAMRLHIEGAKAALMRQLEDALEAGQHAREA
jgi:DNA-binding GntR family transcriptional regulator